MTALASITLADPRGGLGGRSDKKSNRDVGNCEKYDPGRSCGIMRTMINVTRSQLSHSISMQIGRRTKPIVSPDYIVGLTDGEGCFYVNVKQNPAYRAGAGVQLYFHIKLNARDRDVLEKVKNTLQCGNVYFQKEQRSNHTQCFRYSVGSHRDNLRYIIPFFKQYPLQSDSKRRSFNIFCQIAEMLESKQHLTKNGIEAIKLLKQRMNQRTIGLA